MEITIAIGLGVFFALAGLAATIAVYKTLPHDKEDKR